MQFVIGELSRRTGYSPAMIRYFEKTGVISPSTRTTTGYRLFGTAQIRELGLVRRMQDLGLHTGQIRKLREIKQGNLSEVEKRERIQQVFDEHARYLERKIAQFAELKSRLDQAAPDFVALVLEEKGEDPDEKAGG